MNLTLTRKQVERGKKMRWKKERDNVSQEIDYINIYYTH